MKGADDTLRGTAAPFVFVSLAMRALAHGSYNTLQEKFRLDRIKVGGKVGNLGDLVSVSRDKAKVQVNADTPFSKRYLKYLSKKCGADAGFAHPVAASAAGVPVPASCVRIFGCCDFVRGAHTRGLDATLPQVPEEAAAA